MGSSLESKIVTRQQTLEKQGLLRQRKALLPSVSLADKTKNMEPQFTLEEQSYLNFSSNDYLGFSRAPALVEALYNAAKQYGVGSGASPLVTGYTEAHLALETKLCELTGFEAALLFSSGFSANTALCKTLFDRHDMVLADKLVHASIIDGLRDSGADFKRFLHNSTESAGRLLAKNNVSALITESVFSMDGDIAPIKALSALCREHRAWLIVDDAHGFGVIDAFGDTHLGCEPRYKAADLVDVQIVTFGKALGCQGAAILGSRQLIDFLVSNAREYIYSTALSPVNAALTLAAVKYGEAHPEIRQKLQSNISYFKQLCSEAHIPLLGSETAIQPLIIGDAQRTLIVAQELKMLGIWIGAIRPPTVPVGSARLRITLTASHSESSIERCVQAIAQVLAAIEIPKASERTEL